jgi:hypothetical protein
MQTLAQWRRSARRTRARHQFGDYSVKRLDQPIRISLVERHRRPDLHDVVKRSISPGENPLVAHPIHDVRRFAIGWLERLPIAHELDAEKEP